MMRIVMAAVVLLLCIAMITPILKRASDWLKAQYTSLWKGGYSKPEEDDEKGSQD